MDNVIDSHPEWDGLVIGMVINTSTAMGVVSGCSNITDVLAFQDPAGSPMWTALGAQSYDVLIFDQAGTLVHKISGAYFKTDSAKVDELVTAVELLLD